MTRQPGFLYSGGMTSTASNTPKNTAPEVPLTWTSSKVWGSVGLTHRASTEINGERWTFTVDSPSKGQWVARAWRDGDMTLYREDRTMKGAKEQAQTHANYVATQTCTEVQDSAVIQLRDEGAELLAATEPVEDAAPDITGTLPGGTPVVMDHKMDAERLTAYGTELAPDVLKKLGPAEAQQLMGELEETFPHLAEWKANVLGSRMQQAGQQLGQVAERMTTGLGPAIVSAHDAVSRMTAAIERVQAARDRVQMRKDTCGCRTPLHTMRCGVGGRARVISPAVSL